MALAAAVGLFHLAVNLPVLGFDWVYFDDDINILLNPHLTGGSWDGIKWAWSDLDYTRRYMPLGWMFFDGLLGLGGLDPTFYHAVAWILGAVNGVLLFQIVRHYCRQRNPIDGWTDVCAFIVVVLLAVHPWRAELSAWSSGLLYLLGQLLASLAVLSSIHFIQSVRRQVVSAGLYLLAQLVYPVFLGLPVIMLILEVNRLSVAAPLRQRWAEALRRYGAWLVLALATGVVNWFAAATATQGFTVTEGLNAYPIATRLVHFVTLISHYVGRLLWPGDTAAFYGTATDLSHLSAPFFIAGLALLGWTICVLRASTRPPAWAVIGLIFVSLLPFAGLLDQNQTANDRYTFLFLAVLAGMFASLMNRTPRGWPRNLIGCGAITGMALLLPVYHQALAVWTDTDHLQARLHKVNASHPHARLNYAKPAITAYLLGKPGQARDRLNAGLSRLGSHIEILTAAEFIQAVETRTKSLLDPLGREIPYAMLHVELADRHRADGHPRAAEAHELFARQLIASHNPETASP